MGAGGILSIFAAKWVIILALFLLIWFIGGIDVIFNNPALIIFFLVLMVLPGKR